MAGAELEHALHSAVDGDPAGFARLWRSLHPPLLRYLTVMCRDAADDVAADTWMQVVRDLPSFAGDAISFRVWIFRIARHRALTYRRRMARHRELPVEIDDERIDQRVRDVAFDVIEGSATDWALGLIASLPPAEAEAVMLRVVAGLDVAQTAEVLDKHGGAVRIATMRGLRRLSAHPEVQARRGIRPTGFIGGAAQPEGV